MGILDNYFKRIIKQSIQDSGVTTLAKAEDSKPANYDVPYNAQLGYPFSGYTNRKDSLSVSFETLRVFSVNYDVVRACINHRKRQIQNLEWEILPKDEKKSSNAYKKDIDLITAFFNKPSHMEDFISWTDKMIEDMLVFDGIVLWKDKTFGGELVELLPVDSGTIRIKVTADGSIPEAPDVAYQQIIKGTKYGEWNVDEMYYKKMNPRNNTPYGLSPLESIILGVDAALKAQMYNSNILSEGSVPEGFLALPPTWNPDQIKDYQVWFDSLMAGNTRFNTRIKMIPGGQGVSYIPTKKPEDMRFFEFEKWLLLKTCALYDVQPTDIGFLDNATYNNSEGQKQAGLQRGLIPTCLFFKRFFNKIISDDFGNNDLKFEWKGLQVTDDSFELERDKAMLVAGAITIDEWRTKQALKPFNTEYTLKPFVMSNGVPLLLDNVEKEKEEAKETQEQKEKPIENNPNDVDEDEIAIEEMFKWETKCLNSFRKGKGVPVFKTDKIDQSIQTLIGTKLMIAKNKNDIKDAFKFFREGMQEKALINKALSISDDIKKYKTQTNANTR